MRKWLMAQAVCVLMLGVMAHAQTEAIKKPVVNKPVPKKDVPELPLAESRMTFAYDTFDFGDVPPGVSVTHDFPVSNTGKDTLIISSIKAG